MSADVKVKICATRSLRAAEVAWEAGAEFIGMVFTPLVKTHTVDSAVARKIGKELKGKSQLVGVFQNMPLSDALSIIDDCNLDYAQFHGYESAEYISKIKINVIKAFRFSGAVSIQKAREEMRKFNVQYYLVDRIKQSEGPMLDLESARVLAEEFPLVFAGGLTPENVADVTRTVRPKIVDVASGVETDGMQDLEKIKRFVKNAKS